MKKNNLYTKHVFICTNKRDLPNQKSCRDLGLELRLFLKQEIIKRWLNKEIRINKSGCLGQCQKGPCLVIYPKGIWEFNLDLEDSEIIVDQLLSEQ